MNKKNKKLPYCGCKYTHILYSYVFEAKQQKITDQKAPYEIQKVSAIWHLFFRSKTCFFLSDQKNTGRHSRHEKYTLVRGFVTPEFVYEAFCNEN